MSDPALLEAFAKQLISLGNPVDVYAMWQGQRGVEPADLDETYRRVTGQEPPAAPGDPRAAARAVVRGIWGDPA